MDARVLLTGPDPVINEFLTNNKTGLAAADGSHPDWIEIYNPGGAAVDLGGWKITAADVNGSASDFVIPTTNPTVTTIGAGAYKIIFCDSQATPLNAAGEIHTNFNLDKSGGSLAFYRPDNTIVSSFDPYPEQTVDVSYGPGPSSTTTPLIATPAPRRVLVPSGSGLGTTWTTADTFNGSTWVSATTGAGFVVIPGGSNPPALPTETEPNDTAAQANDASSNFVAQASSSIYHLGIKASLSAGSDNEYYKIGAMQVGDILSASMSGSASARGANTDPYIELYRGSAPASLIQVTFNDDGGAGTDALIDRFSIATADTYYIKAHSANNTTSGTCDLGIYLENTSIAPTTGGTVITESASNDTGSTATDISMSWRRVQYLSHTTGSLGSAPASDMFKYKLTADDLLTINLDSTVSADLKVTLYNSAGTTILASEDGTSTRTAPYDKDSTLYSFIIPSTGTYYARAQGSAGGAYAMDLYLSTTTEPPVPGSGVQPLYTGLTNADISASMRNINYSVYLRVPFTVIDPTQVTSLILSMKYEDGFVAYLNGQEVAPSNAPGTAGTPPAFNAASATDRTDSSAVTLQDFDVTWQFNDGVTFVFPQGVSMPANGYAMVVPIAPATFRTKYNIPAAIPIYGPYTGALSSGGEKVKPAKPGAPIAGVTPYITEDRVTCGTTAPWPSAPDGVGPALIESVPAAYANDPASWQVSANGGTPGAANLAAAPRGHYIFYNSSTWNNPALGRTDDSAIAPDKQPLLPGQAASFLNYTSYSLGINGIMIDLANLANAPALSVTDFTFNVGNSSDLTSWTAAPAPVSILTRPGGQGAGATDRIELIWADVRHAQAACAGDEIERRQSESPACKTAPLAPVSQPKPIVARAGAPVTNSPAADHRFGCAVAQG